MSRIKRKNLNDTNLRILKEINDIIIDVAVDEVEKIEIVRNDNKEIIEEKYEIKTNNIKKECNPYSKNASVESFREYGKIINIWV